MYAYIKHKQLHCNDNNKFQKLILFTFLQLVDILAKQNRKKAKTNYHEYST